MSQYLQISDQYGHHYLTYIMIDIMEFYNYIRDEEYRLLSGGLKFEFLGLLTDELDGNPIDLLIIPSTLCRESSWNFLPWIMIGIAVVSPFRTAKERSATEEYITDK